MTSSETRPGENEELWREFLSGGHRPLDPVGAGLHTGTAWVGAVGAGVHTELTALGDAVTTAARLASAASAGEVLVSAIAATAAGLDPSLARTPLELKGKQRPTEVVTLTVTADGDAAKS